MTGYLSSQSAAKYLDMTYAAFDQAVRRLGIPHGRLGRQRRFSKDTLDRVLKTMAMRKGSR